MTAADMRASAANLRLLASVFEHNAIAATDVRAGAAWDEAMLFLLDAQTALQTAADALEGVFVLPLGKRAA
jgi:hypothetical protein